MLADNQMQPPSEINHHITVEAIVYGRVQGVGFRATVKRLALSLNLVGTVCNLSDGSVKIYAAGHKPSLDAFITRLHETSGPAIVTNISLRQITHQHSYESFRIIDESLDGE